jgi:porphobilinogen synthase
MVAETKLHVDDFILPLFIQEGKGQKNEIASMPGYYRYSMDLLKKEIHELRALDIKSVLLFVMVPDSKKDNQGTEALNPNGLMQQSIKMIKDMAPELCVMTDVALDPYSEYGHDGIVIDSKIVNDPTNEILGEMAVSHAEAGANFVAPSDMMDGRIQIIREHLEESGFDNTGIMAYSAKYASCFYGPFRDALDSAPGFGDKKTYQMDPANKREAIKEALMDQSEGADILMVKPALSYLDIIAEVKAATDLPIAAYQVSGEYAMIKAAAEKGWLDEQSAMLETLTSIKRAGADLIASYFAKDVVKLFH